MEFLGQNGPGDPLVQLGFMPIRNTVQIVWLYVDKTFFILGIVLASNYGIQL